MYVIANILGKQMKIQSNQFLYIPKLDSKVGSQVNFDQVLLSAVNDQVTIGSPTVKDAQVLAKVIGHIKSKKIIVFKKKRRKGYKKTQGHRQEYTKIYIEKIITNEHGT